jgi:large subunit ribosomal protein L30
VSAQATVRIRQRRSSAGARPNQRETLRSLGLRGIGKTVERPLSPQLEGMIRVVGHLVEVSPASDGTAREFRKGSRKGSGVGSSDG